MTEQEQNELRAIRHQAQDMLNDETMNRYPIEVQIKGYQSTIQTMGERIAKLLEPYNEVG